MSFPRTIEEECRELIPALDKSLKELAFLLEKSKAHIRIDALFQVPLRKSPTVDKNAAIEIATPDGETGIPLAIETLTTIWLGEGQSAKETLRSPGAIGLPALALDRIRETNRLRMHLFDLIEKAKPAERKRIWKAKDHYGISSLQAMRVTPILHDPQLIRFYWDTGSITKRWLVRDLIKVCEDELHATFGHRPSRDEVVQGSVESSVLLSLEQLEELPPDEQVAVHRLGTPHIRARVTDGDLEPYICSAPVPFVYDVSCARPLIKPLKNYCPMEEKKKRSIRALLEPEPRVPGMNVHQYDVKYRAFGAFESRSRGRNKRAAQE